MMESNCPQIHFVDEHFDGKLSAAKEHSWREHLRECAECKRYYNWHLMIPALNRASPKERIAMGLGVRFVSQPRSGWFLSVTAALASAIVAILVIALWPVSMDDSGWVARGGDIPPSTSLMIYRIQSGSSPQLVKDQIKQNDELAFSYLNSYEKKWLMVFGVDENGKVFWFYPAWSRADENPLAIEISRDVSWHELPDAVSHQFSPGRLFLYAVFSDTRYSVKQMEKIFSGIKPGSMIRIDHCVVHVYSLGVVH